MAQRSGVGSSRRGEDARREGELAEGDSRSRTSCTTHLQLNTNPSMSDCESFSSASSNGDPIDSSWDDWTEEAAPATSLFDDKLFPSAELALKHDKDTHGVDVILLAATLGQSGLRAAVLLWSLANFWDLCGAQTSLSGSGSSTGLGQPQVSINSHKVVQAADRALAPLFRSPLPPRSSGWTAPRPRSSRTTASSSQSSRMTRSSVSLLPHLHPIAHSHPVLPRRARL